MHLATTKSWLFNTSNQLKIRPFPRRATSGFERLFSWFVLCLCLAIPVLTGQAASPIIVAQNAYQEAKARHLREPGNAEATWQFARAVFDRAEFATNNTERAELAEQGIAACRQLLARQSNSAPAHYYLGMNLGQLARTKGIGALKIVKEMERTFSLARVLDETIDYAGPDRNLGLLYLDAPSIGSIGNRSKAKEHLERAVELAPDYPENHLNLIEAFVKWNDRNGARRELKALQEIWPRARLALSGDNWAGSWADWQERLDKFRKKIEEPPKALESPSHKV